MRLSPAECNAADSISSSLPPRAIYVHVPYCRRVCPYCAFAVHAIGKPGPSVDEYTTALCSEFRLRRSDSRVTSLYFGGGTPSILSASNMARIVGALRREFDLTSLREFTVEANPEDIDARLARDLVALGVNRVSLGAQSFDGKNLRLLGRRHDKQRCIDSVAILRDAGVEHLNLDLIIGLPGQSEENLRSDLGSLESIAIDHVSCYMLSYEAGTPYERQRTRGSLRAIGDDQVVAYYRLTRDFLGALGFQHYEVSNFARPGHRCKQNAAYWARRGYLGFGPSAASYMHGVRRKNHPKLAVWYAHLRAGRDPAIEVETLTERQRFLEALMLGLRRARGIQLERLREEFGPDLPQLAHSRIAELVEENLIVSSAVSLRPTPRGFELADSLAERLLNDRDPDRR